MKKIVKFKNLLIMLIFFNIFTFVIASPTTTASILLLNSKESNKNEEKSIEQVNEEFKFLYENKENFTEVNNILSKNEKVFLINKYTLRDELWDKMILKYQKQILKQKEETKIEAEAFQSKNLTKILKYFVFYKLKRGFIFGGILGGLVLFLKIIISILTKDSKKENSVYSKGD